MSFYFNLAIANVEIDRGLASAKNCSDQYWLIEDSGAKPLKESAASSNAVVTSDDREASRAAPALHSGCPGWLQLSSLGADLQSVLLAWKRLPESIRRAILALVESQEEGRVQR